MRSPRFATLVTETGERVAVRENRPPGQSYGRQFFTMFDSALLHLVRKVRGGPALRVFLRLPARLDWPDWRKLDQKSLADEIGMHRTEVSRALAELVTVGVIERRGRGPTLEWRLSLDWGWRGQVDAYHAEQRARQREHAGTKPGQEGGPLPQKGYYGKSGLSYRRSSWLSPPGPAPSRHSRARRQAAGWR